VQHESTTSRLRALFAEVVNGFAQLTAAIPVRWFNRDTDYAIFICPEYYWGELSAEQRVMQMQLKRTYEPVSELLHLLLTSAPEDLVRQLEEADKQFRIWLELQDNWSLSPNASENEKNLRSAAAELEKVLSILEVRGNGEILVVPDTNSLLRQPDPTAYRSLARAQAFHFLLLPTVLGELDRLKIEHRNPDVRDKAKAVIARVKGWRQQGSLNSGVTVDKSILVRACHKEPDMKRTLSWLDPNVQDDRIIASVLALQAEQPSSRVVLVTGDINLQNKADAAMVETAESP
jgi:PIN domain